MGLFSFLGHPEGQQTGLGDLSGPGQASSQAGQSSYACRLLEPCLGTWDVLCA